MSNNLTNAQQADYWTSVGGPHWVNEQRQFDHMLAPFSAESQRVLAAQPGEHILDVGCGTATTTIAIAHSVGETGSVVGCDISPTMIDAARARAAAHPQVSFAIADAQTDDLLQADLFDAVYSRFGVMFFADPVAAFRNIASSVRTGGRLVFVCWQAEEANEWISVPAAVMRSFTPAPVLAPIGSPGPFAFGDPTRIDAVLTAAGWTQVDVAAHAADIELGGGLGVDAALRQSMGTRVAQGLREQVDDETYAAATDAVRGALAEHVNATGGVEFVGAVWVVTAIKP